MSDPMLVALFLFIVFAPCLFACVALADKSAESPIYGGDGRKSRGPGRMPVPLQAVRPEVSICEDFEIRRFAKGIAQHRIVIRDSEDGARLTIAQVREAAAELLKLGGMIAVRALTHAVAASAAAMNTALVSTREAAAIAAKNAWEWFDWGEAMARERTLPSAGERPSLVETPRLVARWQQAVQQAA